MSDAEHPSWYICLYFIYILSWALEQRPLKAIALQCGDVYIPRGVAVPALDRKKQWEFKPKGLSM